MAKASNKLVATAGVVAFVVIVLVVLASGPKEPPVLKIHFAGITNLHGTRQLVALYVATNVNNVPLTMGSLSEVKTGGEWPVYGPDMRALPVTWPDLPAYQSAVYEIPIPDYGSAWRVQFHFAEALTKWDKLRLKSATWLYRQKLNRVARMVWSEGPLRKGQAILMSEMDTLPPGPLRTHAQTTVTERAAAASSLPR